VTAYWDDHGLPELRASMHQVTMLIKTQVLLYFYFFIARQYAPSGHAHQDAGFVLFLFFY
jgi:hypothetical protein